MFKQYLIHLGYLWALYIIAMVIYFTAFPVDNMTHIREI